jgi:hypothetical protein
MAIVTSPAYVHLQCVTCEDIIDIPVPISVTVGEDSMVKISLREVDLQPMFDHKFENHMNLFD